MSGPAPKVRRQRRNEPARGEWVDLSPLDKPVLPALPDEEWSERTRSAWAAWGKDAVTGEYHPADIQSALDLAYLYEGWVQKPSGATFKEVRQMATILGLNPKGKRDLRWRVSGPAEVVDMPAPKKQRRLRAVD